MGDPSDRFATLLDCGCEQAQGTWFYCPEHQPRPPSVAVAPLDLAAIENAYRDAGPNAHDGSGTILLLLAHCRALRAALTEIVDPKHHDPMRDLMARKNAAAVLAQATDARGGARVTGPRGPTAPSP